MVCQHDLAADPRYATMRARNERIDELYGLLESSLVERTTAQWLEAFGKADIPAGRMNSLDDLLVDPHLQAVGLFEVVEHPTEGTIRTMRLPMSWSRSQPARGRPAPNLGEHGREILQELGMRADDIAALVDSGALRVPAAAERSES